MPKHRSTSRFDWTTLFDGNLWKLIPDEYESVGNFRRAAYQAAERHGLKVSVSVRYGGTADEHVLIQAVPRV